MIIVDYEIKILPVKMNSPFRISYGVIDQLENVYLKILTADGISGFGEASAIGIITGETNAGVCEAIHQMMAHLLNKSMTINLAHELMNTILYGNGSAKAAIDMAIYDVMSKMENQPLYQYLGASLDRLNSDVTLAIESVEESLKKVDDYIEKGFKIFKIKANENYMHCVELIREMEKRYPGVLKYRIDANQGWNSDAYFTVQNLLNAYKIEYIEQPVYRKDYLKLTTIKRQTQISLMADESVFDLFDAKLCLEMELVDYINIKLMKCGGIYPALQIAEICKKNGIKCGIGCMMESKLGLAAAHALALSNDNITLYDLDSILHIQSDEINSGLHFHNSDLVASQTFGLGLLEEVW